MPRLFADSHHAQRGAVAPIVAICLFMFVGFAALAIDLGMAFNSRSEAQRAADAAALAGASVFLEPNPAGAYADSATARAVRFAEENAVLGRDASTQITVEPFVADGRVRVTVRHTELPAWFSGIFGKDKLAVGATATAQAMNTGSARCVKPFMIPDAFEDKNGDGRWTPGVDFYQQDSTGYGTPFRNAVPDPIGGGTPKGDLGRVITLKAGSPHEAQQPGWFFPIRVPGNKGGKDYREQIADRCPSSVLSVGDTIRQETGNMIGPTAHGLAQLIAQDPGAYWNGTQLISQYGINSPRVATIPLFRPDEQLNDVNKSGQTGGNGGKLLVIHSFGSFFIESISCTPNTQGKCPGNQDPEVRGRWLGLVDTAPVGGCHLTGTCLTHAQYLRLIE